MGIEHASYRKAGQMIGKSKHKRLKHIYERRAAAQYAIALERRDGSQGAASKLRSVEITPELRARYER